MAKINLNEGGSRYLKIHLYINLCICMNESFFRLIVSCWESSKEDKNSGIIKRDKCYRIWEQSLNGWIWVVRWEDPFPFQITRWHLKNMISFYMNNLARCLFCSENQMKFSLNNGGRKHVLHTLFALRKPIVLKSNSIWEHATLVCTRSSLPGCSRSILHGEDCR